MSISVDDFLSLISMKLNEILSLLKGKTVAAPAQEKKPKAKGKSGASKDAALSGWTLYLRENKKDIKDGKEGPWKNLNAKETEFLAKHEGKYECLIKKDHRNGKAHKGESVMRKITPMVILSQRWEALTEAEKKKYQERAKVLREDAKKKPKAEEETKETPKKDTKEETKEAPKKEPKAEEPKKEDAKAEPKAEPKAEKKKKSIKDLIGEDDK